MKKRNLLIIAMIVMLVTVISLGGCNSGGSKTSSNPPDAAPAPAPAAAEGMSEMGDWLNVAGPIDVKHVGISFESLHTDFAAVLQSETASLCEARGWTYDVNEANEDSMTQVSQCENMIAKGVDLLIIKPNDESSFAPISQLCQEQNIPLIILADRLISPYTISSTSDDYNNGVLSAQDLIAHNPGTLHKTFLLRGPLAADVFNLRAEGSIATLEAAGYEIVYSATTAPIQDQALAETENFLATSPEIDSIIAGTDSQAIGAGIAVQEAGLSDQIYIVGIDGQVVGATNILKGGQMNGTLYLPPELYVRAMFDSIDKLVAGQPYDQDTVLEPEYMDASNVNKFYPDLKV